MSHVTRVSQVKSSTTDWVMSCHLHLSESCHVVHMTSELEWHDMCHVTRVSHEWVRMTWHVSRWSYIRVCHVTYEWVVSGENETWHIYEDMWVLGLNTNESCTTWMSHVSCEWVTSDIHESCRMRMSHVTYECVTSHTRRCDYNVGHEDMYVSRVTCEWVAAYI